MRASGTRRHVNLDQDGVGWDWRVVLKCKLQHRRQNRQLEK